MNLLYVSNMDHQSLQTFRQFFGRKPALTLCCFVILELLDGFFDLVQCGFWYIAIVDKRDPLPPSVLPPVRHSGDHCSTAVSSHSRPSGCLHLYHCIACSFRASWSWQRCSSYSRSVFSRRNFLVRWRRVCSSRLCLYRSTFWRLLRSGDCPTSFSVFHFQYLLTLFTLWGTVADCFSALQYS